MKNEYYLNVRWKNRPMTAREYLAFSRGLLQTLVKFDPVFANLFSWKNSPQKAWFAENYTDLDDKIFPLIGLKESRYENPDPDNWELTLDSKFATGFSSAYHSTDKAEEGKLTVHINAGGTSGNSTNVVRIEFPEVNYPQFYEYDYVFALTKRVIEYCQPREGFVISHPFWNAVESEKVKSSTCPVGWLTYLADASVNDLLPPDVEREVLSTGGTLITLKHEPLPSPDNPEDVAKAIRIRDILLPLLVWE